MALENLANSGYGLPVLTGACFVIGVVIKNTPLKDPLEQWIPLIVAIVGAVIGGFYNPEYDLISSTVNGAIAGLGSTGIYEIGKNSVRMLKEE